MYKKDYLILVENEPAATGTVKTNDRYVIEGLYAIVSPSTHPISSNSCVAFRTTTSSEEVNLNQEGPTVRR